MYQAELRGKLPSETEAKEDILTSNVFSFFKYARRDLFLRRWLDSRLNIKISDSEASMAEFNFWPRYVDSTQPDVVIVAGSYYILVEAKYLSDFSGETSRSKSQLMREIENGELEAKNYGKEFLLVAITADHYFRSDRFRDVPQELRNRLVWTNWQSVAAFLEEILSADADLASWEREFAIDLEMLLDRKKLRDYRGVSALRTSSFLPDRVQRIFFQAADSEYRGEFIGFVESLRIAQPVAPTPRMVFLLKRRKLFSSLYHTHDVSSPGKSVFFKAEVKL
jgi:hypothetical protein